MTKSTKIAIAAAAAITVIIIGAWIYAKNIKPQEKQDTQQSQDNLIDGTPTQKNPANGEENGQAGDSGDDGNNGATSSKDTSDTALDKDLSIIDSQINNLQIDSSDIDKGLNDQPIEQDQ